MTSRPSRLKRLTGPLLLSLTLLGAGCASTSTVKQVPPPALTQDCPTPPPRPLQTNMDLLWVIQDFRLALDLCNADKAALRAWSEE